MVLDAARVVQYAALDEGVMQPGRTSALLGGVAVDLDSVRGVIIAEDLVQGTVFLLHCNERWETLAAGAYAGVEEARQAIESSYPGAASRLRAYRALTAQEETELETTRRFLRQLAAGDFDF